MDSSLVVITCVESEWISFELFKNMLTDMHRNPPVTVVTSLYDASIIASPTSGAPPTGTYALSLGEPEETQCDCLTNKDQQLAWDCNLSPNSALSMIVDQPPNSQGLGAVLQYASYDWRIGYGAQLSFMNTSFAQFLTVQDQDDKQNGPAFYFQQFYDKVVVVPEAAISTSSSDKIKRALYSPEWSVPEAWQRRKQRAFPGEKPWFCVWNETLLEGFIYVTESLTTTTSMTQTINSSVMPSTSPPSSPALATATPTSTDAGVANTFVPSGRPAGGPIITSTLTHKMTTATYTGPASGFTPWSFSVKEAAKQGPKDAGPPESHPKRDDGDGDGDVANPMDQWTQLPKFPFLVKLEERRVEGAPTPYCQQYQILDNGHANWISDDNGKPVIVQLDEQDPDYDRGARTPNRMMQRRSVPNACHCQWMSGEN